MESVITDRVERDSTGAPGLTQHLDQGVLIGALDLREVMTRDQGIEHLPGLMAADLDLPPALGVVLAVAR